MTSAMPSFSTCSTNFSISEPSLGFFKAAECMLEFGERSRPLSRRQIEQEFRCPGSVICSTALDEAGDNHPMEQHVIATRSKPGEFVGHSEPSGEDNDSSRTCSGPCLPTEALLTTG